MTDDGVPGSSHPRSAAHRKSLGAVLRNPWLIQLVVAGAMLALAAWQVDFAELGQTFAQAHYAWLLVALAVYSASRLIHAVEWRITLTKVGRAPFLGLFGALLIGTLVNSVVPAAAGDVVKIQVVANRYGLPRAGLFAGRGAEAVVNAAIMTIFIMVSFALPSVGFGSRNLLWLLAAATTLVFTGAIVGSRTLPESMPGWRILRRLPRRLYDGLERQWPRFAEGLEVIRRPRLLAFAIALNLLGWAADLTIYWSYGQAFGLDLPFAAYLSVTVVAALISVFPITFGNIGTFELVVLSVLALYAVPSEHALAFAAGTHAFGTVANIGLGIIAMWCMGVQPRDVFRLHRAAPSPTDSESGPPGIP
jgi:uncharacterized protein (TIRG00374 family)